MRALILASLLLASPAAAEEPMTAAEFEAYVTGRTLAYGTGGDPYGIEAYYPGRRVTWAFVDGDCTEGEWYQRGPDICFTYEDLGEEQCWQIFREGDGLRAVFTNDPENSVLYEVTDADIGLICPGYGV